MSAYLRDEAFVLSVRPYREADAWISCWTKFHGKQEALATGLRRAKAKHAGHLQPFSCVELVLAEGKWFHRLSIARMTSLHGANIRTHAQWIGILGSITRLCDEVTVAHLPEEPSGVFAFFLELHALTERFPERFSLDRALFLQAFFLTRFARLIGYGVSVRACVRCGAEPVSCTGFSLPDGGFFCKRCETEQFSPRSFSFKSDLELLRRMMLFLERASFEEVMRVSAPRGMLQDASFLCEGMLQMLPVRQSPARTGYLVSVS